MPDAQTVKTQGCHLGYPDTLNAYFLWHMLNTGTHRKRNSTVNRSCVSKPVIRMLCASLAYKKRVIRIHSVVLQVLVVYHLQKLSGNSGWKVNGTRLFVSFQWKISESNGTSEKVVLFFQTECSKWKFVFHLFKPHL